MKFPDMGTKNKHNFDLVRPRLFAGLSIWLILISTAWGQSGTLKSVREADGGGFVAGYYNETNSVHIGANGTGGVRLNLSTLTEDAIHKLLFNKNAGGWNSATNFWKGGIESGSAAFSTAAGVSTAEIDIIHSQLTAAPYSMTDGDVIQFGFDNNGTSNIPDYVCDVTGGGNDLNYDILPPTISSVSSTTIDDSYGISAGINVRVTFSENVDLTIGQLRVTLNTGRTVDIPSASYAPIANVTYTVQEGDETGDLTNTNVQAVSGGTVKDAAGNALTNYVPGSNIGTTSDIAIDGVRPTITSVTSSTSDGTYGIGANVNITVTFSEPTTVTIGDLRVTLDTGQDVDIPGATYSNSASGTYTILEGHASVDLTTTSIINTAGAIEDAVGNALTNFTPVTNLGTSSAIVVDGVRPTITSVNSLSASATYGIGDNIGITVYFNETVTLASGNLLVELETGGVDQQAIITPFAGASSGTGTYTVQINDVSADLTENSVSLSGGTLRDVAGNDLTVFTVPPAENLNDNKAIVIDGVRPTISIVTSLSGNGNYMIGNDILIQVTFDEDVTLAGGNLLVTLETGTTDRQVTISSVISSSTATGTYTVQDGDENTDLTAKVVGLSSGTLEDVGGNNITDFTIPPGQNIADLKAIVVDGIRPTIDYITSTTVDATYNIGDPVNIRLFFTEAVTTSGGGDIVVTLETGATDRQVTISNVVSSLFADGTYTVQDGDENTDLNVNTVVMSAGSLVDDFGNAVSDFSIPGGENLADYKALVIDGIRPTVTNVSATTFNGAYKALDGIDITVQFSEAVDVLGLPTLNLDVGGGYLVSNPAGTGTNTLTFTYTIQATHNSGDLDYVDANSLLDGGGSIRDAAGNDATLTLYGPGTGVPGAGSLGDNKALIIDTQVPTVTNVTSSLADTSYKAGVTVPITVTFSEAVIVSGAPTLKLETGTIDRDATYTGVSDATLSFEYLVQSGDETNDLDYWDINSLTAGTYIRDAAGNDAIRELATPGDANSLSYNKALVIDTTPPTVLSVSSTAGDGYYVKDDVIPITVTFSETIYVAGAGTPTLTLETGTVDALVNYVNGSDGDAELLFNYTVGLGHESDNLDYTATDALEPNLGTITDAAGNDADLTLASPGASGSLGFSKNRDVDAIIPTVTGVTSNKADGAYKAGVVIPISVAFSEAVVVAGGPPTLTLNIDGGYAVDYTSISGDTLVFEYTVQAGQNQVNLDYVDANSLLTGGGSIRDAAGNDADPTLTSPGTVGSLSNAKNLDVDTATPAFSSVAPANSSYQNSTKVSYTLSEDIASGSITWSRTSGTADPGEPHIQALTGTELAAGAHTDITLTNDPSLVSNTEYSLTFYGVDAAGNDTSIVRTAVSFDDAPPTVSSVSSTAGDGYYVAGDTIFITVNLTETVYKAGVGTPTLALETGSTDAVLDYVSGSGTNTLTFTYIVALGHESDNLDYVDASALQLNLATIRDTTGNDADLDLPTPGTSGSLGFGKDRNIDAVIPTVTTVTSTKADGAYKADLIIPIAVVFSENVGVLGTPTLTLDVGGGYDVDYANRTSGDTLFFDYTVLPGHNKTDLGYVSTTALKLNGGSIQDAATNPADTTLPTPNGAGSLSGTKDLIIDTEMPTVSQVTSSTANGRYSAGDTLAISIVFSEAVTVTGGQPRLTLETDVNDTEASYTSGSGSNTLIFNYVVQAGDSSDDLGYVDTTSLSFNGAVIADAGDNVARIILPVPGGAGSLSANKDFVIDTHAPSVMSVSSSTTDGWYKAGVVIPIRVAFSERVTVSGTPTLTLDVVDGYAVNYTSGSGNAALVFNYTVQDSHDCADLDYQSSTSLSLNGGVINDLGRNGADLSLPSPGADSSLGGTKDLILDTQAPSVLTVVVYDGPAADIDSTSSTDSLAAHWTGFSDPVAGIALYEYAIGTTRDSSDVVDWTSNGTDTLVTVKGLQLTYKRRYYVSVRATDGAGNVSDSVSSDGVRIVDRPRLTVNVVQNSVISEYVQIFVIDTLAMSDSIGIVMDSLRVSVTGIDTFAYVGTHKYTRSGPHSLEVIGFSGWGDTTRTSSLAMALAKQGQPWVATSVDQRFTTAGSPGSVSSDRYLLVVDSTLMGLSAVPGGAYRLGDGQFTFNQPVRVSMRRGLNEAGREAQAIYVLRSNGGWEELPSVDEGELVTSWTNRAGTFRLGRRTIIVPQATSLHQNYPNPFNPTTRIVFDLGFQDGPRQHARVVIYNLLGQEVLTLYDGEASTGRYELTWQGVDARGLAVASGVYFVRLSTSTGHQMTKKMLLIR